MTRINSKPQRSKVPICFRLLNVILVSYEYKNLMKTTNEVAYRYSRPINQSIRQIYAHLIFIMCIRNNSLKKRKLSLTRRAKNVQSE